jgi:hypothetical protein
MERVIAFAPNGRAIVARDFTIRTARFKRRAANPTAIISSVPFPGRHPMPARDLNFDHGSFAAASIATG